MRTRIAVVTGGLSPEAPSSYRSAERVIRKLSPIRFDPDLVVYDECGFRLANTDDIRLGDDTTSNLRMLDISAIASFDCAFMTIHGTPGEDGGLQGFFDTIGLPYTSSGVATCAITTDKFACKAYLEKRAGISTPKAMLFSCEESSTESVIDYIGLPCVVKPNKSGSSLGVSVARNPQELELAILEARRYDGELIVEKLVCGREVTVGVLLTLDREIVLPISEIRSNGNIIDTATKLAAGHLSHKTPASLPADVADILSGTALNICRMLSCRGIVRLDFILDNDVPHFLEINTVPGFTDHSLIPLQLERSGLGESESYGLLIEDAITRHERIAKKKEQSNGIQNLKPLTPRSTERHQ